jgi:hypothetical protein
VLRVSALPYGYTVTVWTSGAMLTRHEGAPSTGQVFLFMLGAVAGYALLAAIVKLGKGVPFDPPKEALRRTGMLHFLAVGGALGAAALVSLIHDGAAWPLGAFVATATYLVLATLELRLAHPPRDR